MTRREIARLEGGEGALKGLITKKAVSLTYEVTYKLKEKFERTVALSTDGLAQKEAGILRGKGQLLVLSFCKERIRFLCVSLRTAAYQLASSGTLCQKASLPKESSGPA